MSVMFQGIAIVLCALLGYVAPHGYLKNPPQRSSMWRFGYNVPPNYDDMGLNCGGTGVQNSAGGKCGICGDPYNAEVKENEAGGKYALGVIAGTYESGETIDAEVKITANHLGYFEFRLCPHNDPTTEVTQTCLDRNLLIVGPEGQTKFYIGSENMVYTVPVQLPVGVTCSQCVLQWTYTAGNNWGCNSPGDCGPGKGLQEQFVNCADITITGDGSLTEAPPTEANTATPTDANTAMPTDENTTTPMDANTAKPTDANTATATDANATTPTDVNTATNTDINTATPTDANTATPTDTNMTTPIDENTATPYDADTAMPSNANTAEPTSETSQTTSRSRALTTTSETAEMLTESSISKYDDCRGAGLWAGQEGMANWCKANCARGYCPESHCNCQPEGTPTSSEYDDCRGAGLWAGQLGIADWCKMNCALGFCPKSHCNCTPEDTPRRKCKATGLWRTVPFLSDWCDTNCNHVPEFCPSTHCACSD